MYKKVSIKYIAFLSTSKMQSFIENKLNHRQKNHERKTL